MLNQLKDQFIVRKINKFSKAYMKKGLKDIHARLNKFRQTMKGSSKILGFECMKSDFLQYLFQKNVFVDNVKI